MFDLNLYNARLFVFDHDWYARDFYVQVNELKHVLSIMRDQFMGILN